MPTPRTVGAVSATDLAVDHALADVAESFRFLLDITPIDAADRRAAFLAGDRSPPDFTYRELERDPLVTRNRLRSVDIGAVDDPVLAVLLSDKQRELELQVQMLEVRCTGDFLPLSIELYGGVEPALRDRALDLLARVPAPGSDSDAQDAEAPLDGPAFAALAQAEVDRYLSVDPGLGMRVEVRTDVADIVVTGHDLLIAETTSVPASRAEALVQHEVGTHLVTHVNGAHQPLRLMAAGLAGYEETQEGLAVFAEYLVDGLTASRLRQLAGRVVAVDRVVAGDGFLEVLDALVDLGLPVGHAFDMTMRVHRGGGFTKDVIYLRGLIDLLDHLAARGTLDPLWSGKVALRDLPRIEDLHRRGALVAPRVLPRYLTAPGTGTRLRQAAACTDLPALIRRTL